MFGGVTYVVDFLMFVNCAMFNLVGGANAYHIEALGRGSRL